MAQAFQSRLGSLSPAATLTPFLLHDIMKLAKSANSLDIESRVRKAQHAPVQVPTSSECVIC
jgi:hypothetical protein